MPRPKRIKIAPPISSVSSTRTVNPTTSRMDDYQPDLISASSGPIAASSDDSDGLVTTKKSGAGQNLLAPYAVTMSGALAPGDSARTRLRPPAGGKRTLFSKIVIDASHAKAIEALKARRDAELMAERASQVQVPSSRPDTDLPSVAPPAKELKKLSNDTSKPRLGLESKASELPVARNSLLPASNIKARPRKPSLLQLVQAQANQQQGDGDDDLDDFLPDDESTPFLKTKPTTILRGAPSSPLISQKTSSSRKRKLSTPEVQVPMTQPNVSQSSLPASLSPTTESELEIDLFNKPSDNDIPEPSLPLPKPSRIQSPDVWSDTLAPPRSSSPISPVRSKSTKSSTKPPARKNLPHNTSRPPTPAHASSKPASRPPMPLSTATLQNLLPRRRARPITREPNAFDIPESSDAEIDASGLGEDEDELSVPTKPRGRPKKRNVGSGNKTALSAKAKGGKASAAVRTTVPKRSKEKTPGKLKTYARSQPVQSDNDEDEDHTDAEGANGTDAPGTATSSEELKRLAAKFREVDEWALEIEDVTASSETLKDAR